MNIHFFFINQDHMGVFEKCFKKSNLSHFEFVSKKKNYPSGVDPHQFQEFLKDKMKKINKEFDFYKLEFKSKNIKVEGKIDDINNFLQGSKDESKYCLKALYDKFQNESAPEQRIDTDDISLRKALHFPGIFYNEEVLSMSNRITIKLKDGLNIEELKYKTLQSEFILPRITSYLYTIYFPRTKEGYEKQEMNYGLDFIDALMKGRCKYDTAQKEEIDKDSRYIWAKVEGEDQVDPLNEKENFELEKFYLMKKFPIDKINESGDDEERMKEAKINYFKYMPKELEKEVILFKKNKIKKENITQWIVTIKKEDLKNYIENENEDKEPLVATVKDVVNDEEFTIERYDSYKSIDNKDPLKEKRIKISRNEIEEDDTYEDKNDNDDEEEKGKDFNYFKNRNLCQNRFFLMFSPEENNFKDIWVSASHSSIGQIKKSIEENLKLDNKLT